MLTVKCHLCGTDDYRVVFPGNSRQLTLRAEHIAAREGGITQQYRHNWVRCNRCGLVYVNPAPDPQELEALYRESDQSGYDQEVDNVVYTYSRYLSRYLNLLPDRALALEVGAGDGFFLKAMLDLGFQKVVGFEPSTPSYQKAPPEIRPHIINGPFAEDALAPGSVDLITCFQTLEHLPTPGKTLAGFSRLLRPGGLVMVVAHNFDSLGVRLLGVRHPIVNAGHLALFDPLTLRKIFASHFEVIDVFKIVNRYSLHYWLSLVPVNERLKARMGRAVSSLGLSSLTLALSLGNMAIVARKLGN